MLQGTNEMRALASRVRAAGLLPEAAWTMAQPEWLGRDSCGLAWRCRRGRTGVEAAAGARGRDRQRRRRPEPAQGAAGPSRQGPLPSREGCPAGRAPARQRSQRPPGSRTVTGAQGPQVCTGHPVPPGCGRGGPVTEGRRCDLSLKGHRLNLGKGREGRRVVSETLLWGPAEPPTFLCGAPG